MINKIQHSKRNILMGAFNAPGGNMPRIIKQNIPPRAADKLTCRLLGQDGRLGNQMFQIAAVLGIAMRNKGTPVFPHWHYSSYFKNALPTANDDLGSYPTYFEPQFVYSPVAYSGNVNLKGYFQSERYFEHCKEIVRYYFEPADLVIENLTKKYPINSVNCSLHIRKGDYVGNASYYQCDIDYYNRAIQYIKSHILIDNFFVFSDDVGWCKGNLTENNFIYIEGNQDIEDLFLMSLCNHNIICNSTFSWWGSWLNKNTDKIIIAPNMWFGPALSHYQSYDVYTRDMIRI